MPLPHPFDSCFLRAMYEILGAMKIIKLNAWEDSFQERVSELRDQEVGFLRR